MNRNIITGELELDDVIASAVRAEALEYLRLLTEHSKLRLREQQFALDTATRARKHLAPYAVAMVLVAAWSLHFLQ